MTVQRERLFLPTPPRPLTMRVAFVSLVLTVALTAFHGIAGLMRHENLGLGYLPRSGLTVLVLLVAINALLRRWWARANLSWEELLTLFACFLVTGSIPGQEFGIHFYLNLLAFVWHSRPGMPFAEQILTHLDPKFLPGRFWSDPAVYFAYQGVDRWAQIPWRDWALPLLLWTPYFLLVYWTLAVTAALFVRRWEEEERLLYPLMQVPALLAHPQRGALFWRHPLFWLGFGTSCFLWSL